MCLVQDGAVLGPPDVTEHKHVARRTAAGKEGGAVDGAQGHDALQQQQRQQQRQRPAIIIIISSSSSAAAAAAADSRSNSRAAEQKTHSSHSLVVVYDNE